MENHPVTLGENIPEFIYSLPMQDRPILSAQGSLFRACVELIIHPTLQEFAAWGRRASQQWVFSSLLLGFVLSESGKFIQGFHLLSVTNSTERPLSLKLLTDPWGWSVTIILDVIFFAIEISLLLWIIARNMPPSFGTMRVRIQRVLRPLSFAIVGIGVTNLAWDFILTGLNTTIVSNEGMIITFLAIIYQLLLLLQAVSIGSHIKRVGVFLMLILFGILIIPLFILMAFISS